MTVKALAKSIAMSLQADADRDHTGRHFTVGMAKVTESGGDRVQYGEIQITEAVSSDDSRSVALYSVFVRPDEVGKWKVLDANRKRVTDGVTDQVTREDVAVAIQAAIDRHN